MRWARSPARAAARTAHVLNMPDSTEVHYRIDGAGILIERLASPHLCQPAKRIAPDELRFRTAPGRRDSGYVLLSKDEYFALLHRSPEPAGARPAASAPGQADGITGKGPIESPLLTEAARRDGQDAYMTQAARSAPTDGTIPQEVLERAAQNHWQLPRAWREYLCMTKQQAAARASITASRYGELEEGFAQISSQRKQVIAFGLSLQAEQLLV